MALPYPISSVQTQAGSPIDEQLMNSIRLDLEFLDGKSAGASSTFRVNGDLSMLDIGKGFGYRVDGTVLSSDLLLSQAILYCEKTGTSGSLTVDAGIYYSYYEAISGISAGNTGEKIISFLGDQSLKMNVGEFFISTGYGIPDNFNYLVIEINRGGAGNYNFVVSDQLERLPVGGTTAFWTGKFKSIFSTKPSISAAGNRAQLSTNAVLSQTSIPQNSMLVMNIESIMFGGCYNAVLTLR